MHAAPFSAIFALLAVAASAATRPTPRPEAARPAPAESAMIDIPYERFVLPNGLTVLVHEDHKAPIVAVNVWYHVGAKNERAGHTGYAHLFEHLMFQGSEHFNDDYFKATDRIGATDLNGTTNSDRTNYFQNVPTSALDTILFLESDRMGHLLGALTQERLDEQRGVVQNEKRQRYDNEPYGLVFQVVAENTYPAGHPYSWMPIGSMEDLNAAKLDDMREWFRTYYGAANAVVTVAGDIDVATAREKIAQYFGDIPGGPPIARQRRWVAKMTGTHRSVMQDRVPAARLYKVWNVPEWGSTEETDLSLLADILTSGKSSRLYKRLVYDDQIATDVSAFTFDREIGSQFYIQATAQPGGDLAAVEKAVDEELARLVKDGPTADELTRVKAERRANFLRGIERIGGFGGKSDVLASGQVYAGDPAHYKKVLERTASATPERLRRVANDWLADGVYVLEVRPFVGTRTERSPIDRSTLPPAPEPPTPAFPAIRTTTLSNGLRVAVVERHAVPLVNVELLVDAGYAADHGGTLGTASLALEMLDEGTTTRGALAISDALARLGARFSTRSTVDLSVATLQALKENLSPSLALFADLVRHPAFAPADLERRRRQRVAQIRREKMTPLPMAMRVLPRLLYGPDHAYAVPFTGSGTEASVAAITRDDLVRFHQAFFKPNNATLAVVGDVSLDTLVPLLESQFAGWMKGDVPAENIGEAPSPAAASVYLIDRPGSAQSILIAGETAPPRSDPRDIAIQVVHTVLGGSATSRLNLNLREDKHWTYGASTSLVDARGPRPFIAYTSVQTDKTKDALREMQRELRGIAGDRPPTADDLAKTREYLTRRLPGRWETNSAALASLSEMLGLGLPLDYYAEYPAAVRALDLPATVAAAREVVQPDRLIWVVVGDREKIEPGIRTLGLGTPKILDADGDPVNVP
jgi:zinc protease